MINNKIFNKNMAYFRYEALRKIRNYFDEQKFIELETPYLIDQNTPDAFIDFFLVSGENKYKNYQLHTSPEIWLKKGLGLGLKKIYSLARVFRDDPLDSTHNKEFLMLEWYRVGEDLESLIQDINNIFARVKNLAEHMFLLKPQITKPVLELSIKNAFWQYAEINLDPILNDYKNNQTDSLTKELLRKGDLLPESSDFFESFSHVMSKYVEPSLPKDRLCILHNWPFMLAALARTDPKDPNYCQRFEVYFGDLEIANAYLECSDPQELQDRFAKENLIRAGLGKQALVINKKFISSVADIPDCVGVALGVDRLFMTLTQRSRIREVIFGGWE